MASFGEYTLTFALEVGTRRLRHVREVKTGQACRCICPGCEEPLEAVNAQAPTYKIRPHFRHLDGQTSADCAARAIAKAAAAALKDVRTLQLPPITPQPRTFFDESPRQLAPPTQIVSFELIDHTEGMLHLPDGRVLRVSVIARTTGGKDREGEFDLILDLSRDDQEKLQSLGNLRTYLTLDSSCWRWCQRQTKPTLLPAEAPPLQLEEETTAVAVLVQPPEVRPMAPLPELVAPTRPVVQPVEEWTEPPIKCPDGSIMLFHRKRWPNGVVTETRERLEPGSEKRLL